MGTQSCKTCAHYRQHYTFDQRKIFRIYCGHCTYQKIKTRRPDTKACTHYLPAETVETAFVSREYLSKALLEYMLRLDLLPEINDIPTYRQSDVREKK